MTARPFDALRVTSEVGRLRRALVHEPGPEIDRMVPAMMEQLLFDDILYGDRAREEHAAFRRVLQLFGIEVLDAADLLARTLEEEPARNWIIEVLLRDLPDLQRKRLHTLDPQTLTTMLVCGDRHEHVTRGIEADELYGMPPLPNWFFQRDPQVVLGDHIIFCSMAAPARHRESLLTRAIFRFHPDFRDTPILFDPIQANRDHPFFVGEQRPSLEGGDVLVLSSDVIAVGLSERTNLVGLRYLARALARREGGPRWMVVVRIPRRRAYMHLDTLITVVDRDACLVYAPVILPGGAEPARISEIDLHANDLTFTPRDDLLSCLASHGVDLEPIRCGGTDPVTEQREQWTDGANALALAPGAITLFDRNLSTADELASHGFRVVHAEDLLLGRERLNIDRSERICVLIGSHEISRARGGPHCLVHPLNRD